MAFSDEDRIRVRPAAPKSRSGLRPQRFVSQVLKQVSKAGGKRSGRNFGGSSSAFGRGSAAASLAGRGLGKDARRVVIKSRFVVLRRAGRNSVATHLRYIERDGVTREGMKGQAYGADTDKANLGDFLERGLGDRHQFRFIVSPEDGFELEDLKGFTRQLMGRMAIDLETTLDWVAVDHWDTATPHTHIVLNGSLSGKADLVISPGYLANGMRMRASEIATELLGPRTEAEIRRSLSREVDQQRLTSLDRSLLRHADGGTVDLSRAPTGMRQSAFRARLQRLEGFSLAKRIDANRWNLETNMAAALSAMGEREDALEVARRAMNGLPREFAFSGPLTFPLLGRVAGKGLANEMHEQGYLVVDGIDGRAHYIRLPAATELAELPLNGIVEISPPGRARAVDESVATIAKEGLYRTADHIARQPAKHESASYPSIDVHVRRLEALRRAGIVERVADGIWKIPPDLVQRAQEHDERKAAGPPVRLHSHLPLDKQVRTMGATWLDSQLLRGGGGVAAAGFGAEVRVAMRSRVEFLAEMGLAQRAAQRVILSRNLLMTLRDRELAAAGNDLQHETGRAYVAHKDGQRLSGVYRRSVQLASGRFAMLDQGLSFTLVPWRSVIEPRLGKTLTAIVHGGSVSWGLGRERGSGVG